MTLRKSTIKHEEAMKQKTIQKTLYVKFGGLAEMGRNFISAWHKAEKSQKIIEKDIITFDDLTSLLRILSNTRLKLIHMLSQMGCVSVRQLSQQLERDYHGVHKDVMLLNEHKFITKRDNKFYVPWSKISIPNVDMVLNELVRNKHKKAS